MSGTRYFTLNYWPERCPVTPKTIQAIVVTLGYPLELDFKTVLLVTLGYKT